MNESIQAATVAYAVSWGIGLVVAIAYFIVAVTIVRKASSRASLLMSLGIATGFVLSCASPILTMGLGRFAEGGAVGFARTQALMTMTGSILGAAGHVLVIVGVVTLARPRKRDVRDPDPDAPERLA